MIYDVIPCIEKNRVYSVLANPNGDLLAGPHKTIISKKNVNRGS
jgi:hypothetical protein